MKNESIHKLKIDLFKAYLKNASIEEGEEFPVANEVANKKQSLILFTENPFEMEIIIEYVPICKYTPGEIGGEDDEWLPGGFEFEAFEIAYIGFNSFGSEVIRLTTNKDIRALVVRWLKYNINF